MFALIAQKKPQDTHFKIEIADFAKSFNLEIGHEVIEFRNSDYEGPHIDLVGRVELQILGVFASREAAIEAMRVLSRNNEIAMEKKRVEAYEQALAEHDERFHPDRHMSISDEVLTSLIKPNS